MVFIPVDQIGWLAVRTTFLLGFKEPFVVFIPQARDALAHLAVNT